MALYTTLSSLSQTASANAADGSVDAPSTIDQQTNALASFIAQLRDGVGLTTGGANLGQCRLTKSGSNLLLSRCNGIGLTINNVAYAIPSAGITLAATGLTVGALYYIYAYMNAGVMTLEAVTTAHATDSTSGMEIKSGDATRTLVGMARPIAGPAWSDLINQRFVVSWFNRRPIPLSAAFTAARSYGAGVYGEPNSEIRNEFLIWPTDGFTASINGTVSHTVTGSEARTCVGVDGSANDGYSAAQLYAGGSITSVAAYLAATASEGYHYTTLLGSNPSASGTISYSGTGTPGTRTSLQTVIQG